MNDSRPDFGEKPDPKDTRAAKIRALFHGGTIQATTDDCFRAGLWNKAEISAAAQRQFRAEVRAALGELIDGKPFAGPTTMTIGKAPIWKQRSLWDLADYEFNFDQYVGRARGNVEVANALALECVERFGSGPRCVHIIPIEDEPEH
jgi:hypothetical protein